MSKESIQTRSRSRRKSHKLRGKVGDLDTAKGTICLSLSIAEVLVSTKNAVEDVAQEAGLLIMKALIDGEVESLSGKRYEHDEKREAYRWGHGETHVVFGGKKIPFMRPRGRSTEGKEVPLERLRLFQRCGRIEEAVARQLVFSVSIRDYEKTVGGVCEGYGIRKSSVSRHWKAISTQQLLKLTERSLGDLDLVAIVVGGVEFGGDVLAVSLGISSDGAKHVLGLWQGATENSRMVKELFEDMIRRGLDPGGRYLFVLHGSKALRKAVRDVFGKEALVHRCILHKRRNVLSHLPKRYHFTYRSRLRLAWDMKSYWEAKKELEGIVEDLKAINESAARSLKEGLEETLTLDRLGIPERLRRSLWSTNIIESCFSATRKFTRNVKHWKNTNMVLRWGGTMLLEAQKRFRRLKSYRAMPALVDAIRIPKVDLQEKHVRSIWLSQDL